MTSSTAEPAVARNRRLVIDSNVWISALVFGGVPRRVFEHVVRHGFVVVTSAQITTETRRVIATKFPDFTDDFTALCALLTPSTVVIALGATTIDACRDPDDNQVLETAVLGDAASIVSGDRDLLALGRYGNTEILSPAAWLTASSAGAPA